MVDLLGPKNTTRGKFTKRKIETIRDRRYKKENLLIQRDKLSRLRRKHVVANEEESDNELQK